MCWEQQYYIVRIILYYTYYIILYIIFAEVRRIYEPCEGGWVSAVEAAIGSAAVLDEYCSSELDF